MLDKEKIINEIKKRPGMELADVESLYQDSLEDICHFTHRDLEELNQLAINSIIKDLMAFRFNTLGNEGVILERFSGTDTQFTPDIPERIKKKLRAFRRLP
ncbi:head-tail connector protein [Helcococcus bovis]|uniref:hypothetical protein n=1 Tax=Helcococcus bovis TaxID=3153252 RepID=UPI0038B7354C